MCERVTGPQADKGASRLCKAATLQAGNASTTTPCSLARTRLTGTSGASSTERGHQNVRPLASPVSYNRNRANWIRQMRYQHSSPPLLSALAAAILHADS